MGFVRRHPFTAGLAGVVIIGLLAWWMTGSQGGDGEFEFTFGTVDRGNIVQVISATGRVNPMNSVEVGSQLSGQIAEILVDYNDQVSAGQVIARIDPQTFEAQVLQARAELQVAKSNEAVSQTDVTKAEAALKKARREFGRKEQLVKKGHTSASDLDAAREAYDVAQAELLSAKARLKNAEANVAQREASLKQTEVDLNRAEIRSPIDGVVIERKVSPGQTLAASMQTPTLFVLARDLGRVQIDASIDEADIGSIETGMPVRFSVSAYPDETFTGEIEQIRWAPNIEQNIVTYTVIITAENEQRKLLPGMTATLEVIASEKRDVLRIPNAALRFKPGIDVMMSLMPPASGASGSPPLPKLPDGPPAGMPAGFKMPEMAWLLNEDGYLGMQPVITGIRNAEFTEINPGTLGPGDQVILRVQRRED